MTNGSLMKVGNIAECSLWSILQYYWPALSDNWSWKPIFGLLESGCFVQVLLYIQVHFREDFIIHGSKHYEPWSDCSFGSSLIWVHIVCNIGYLKTEADEIADGKCSDWLEKI